MGGKHRAPEPAELARWVQGLDGGLHIPDPKQKGTALCGQPQGPDGPGGSVIARSCVTCAAKVEEAPGG
ncbi:hypothetical protein [Longimicrobium sp.]|jgi:anti-sigma factor RsiW|uniref:hypothetical protein n=1 Tax=Longimicrobium sp. TaxID=2029185 RepID=UPI002ED899E9